MASVKFSNSAVTGDHCGIAALLAQIEDPGG